MKTKLFDEFHGNGFTADEFGGDLGKNEIQIDHFRGVDRDREIARLALKQRYYDKEQFKSSHSSLLWLAKHFQRLSRG